MSAEQHARLPLELIGIILEYTACVSESSRTTLDLVSRQSKPWCVACPADLGVSLIRLGWMESSIILRTKRAAELFLRTVHDVQERQSNIIRQNVRLVALSPDSSGTPLLTPTETTTMLRECHRIEQLSYSGDIHDMDCTLADYYTIIDAVQTYPRLKHINTHNAGLFNFPFQTPYCSYITVSNSLGGSPGPKVGAPFPRPVLNGFSLKRTVMRISIPVEDLLDMDLSARVMRPHMTVEAAMIFIWEVEGAREDNPIPLADLFRRTDMRFLETAARTLCYAVGWFDGEDQESRPFGVLTPRELEALLPWDRVYDVEDNIWTRAEKELFRINKRGFIPSKTEVDFGCLVEAYTSKYPEVHGDLVPSIQRFIEDMNMQG